MPLATPRWPKSHPLSGKSRPLNTALALAPGGIGAGYAATWVIFALLVNAAVIVLAGLSWSGDEGSLTSRTVRRRRVMVGARMTEQRTFKICDGCERERPVGQWRVKRLLAGKTRQLGLCDQCSLPLRKADMGLEAEQGAILLEDPPKPRQRRGVRSRLA